jgi:hypothetical protein
MAPRSEAQAPGHRAAEDRVVLTCGQYTRDGVAVTGSGGCGQADDHPKHVTGEVDGSTTVRHLDCCGCTSCVVHLGHAGEKRGRELAAHIQKHGDAIAQAVAAATEAQEG